MTTMDTYCNLDKILQYEKSKNYRYSTPTFGEKCGKTVEFYKEKLGFEVIGLVGNPPVYGMVKRDGFQIHFAHSSTGIVHTNRSPSAACCDFILWIPEIDNFYAALKLREVKIVEEITKRVYGSREFVFQDIDGHHILVGD